MIPEPTLQRPSRRLLAAANPYLRRFTARHFNGLRVARDGLPPALDRPTIFYANHPSWWDPVVLILLIRTHYPDWCFHGPIDISALARYPWLERIGLFGIEPGSLQGARRLLRAGASLLTETRSGLAMTAQGQFSDVRQRPITLRRGIGSLLSRHPNACAIPIAIEYTFWNERLPEILVRFGHQPVAARGRPVAAIQADLEHALEHQLDRLARAAGERDPAPFDCLLQGRRGLGFWQDLPARLRAWRRGERFDPAHGAIDRSRRP